MRLSEANRIKIIQGIWVYLILLIFEGALRKWILPSLSSVLLVIRDPVILGIYLLALRYRILPLNRFMVSLMAIAILSLSFAFFAPNSDLFVILYGLRANFLHMPLIFLMGSIMRYEDIDAMGRFVINLVFPMSILMIFQFLSSPDSWINVGAGADAFQIRATVGNVRPPSVFSFITGVAEYFALASAYLGYYLLIKNTRLDARLLISVIGLLIGLVLSISRLALVSILIVWTLGIFSIIFYPTRIHRQVIGIVLVIFAALVVLQFDFAGSALTVFGGRIDEASAYEGGRVGFFTRISATIFDHFSNLGDIPLTGYGLGMGTSAGAKMMTGDVMAYLLAEDEVARILQESGPIAGLLFLMWRWWLCVYLFLKSLKACVNGDGLPLLLWGAAAPMLLISQLGRPTSLGFTVFISGLCLASLYGRPKVIALYKTG